ncbi:Rieske (2Fe-2S) protein [Novosphingobium lentum]|uniref:Rieske (2Fe-2S) protein n=1 Tax=Novosphingobium lentum TaxID=145287 RepID=UPI00083117E7|nr:Rieske (2Fe-2S) protein [Novosphingobium lentum]
MASPWWKVARSEEVTSAKPLAVDIGDQPVVLWRDAQGIARALEDRCPHRRAPLSRGCIRDNGWIQCGYHGWSYDGETGRLKDIPNMKDEQKFPPVYKAAAYAVAESGGFVSVNLDQKTSAPAPVAEQTFPLGGTTVVGLSQGEWIDALFDDPGLVLNIRGVQPTPYLMSELREEDGLLVMERFCQWGKLHYPSYATAEFPITLITRTRPDTGETEVVLRDDSFRTLLTAQLAPVQAARGVTQVRWRAKLGDELKGRHALALRRKGSFEVRDAVDAAALRVLIRSASHHGQQLRDKLLSAPAVSGPSVSEPSVPAPTISAAA